MTRRTSSSLYIYRGRRTLHVMGHGPGRHMKTRGPSHGKDGRLLVVVSLLHIISWAWPGLACEYIWGPSWAGRSGSRRVHISGASARPGLSIFKMTGRGPARPGPPACEKPNNFGSHRTLSPALLRLQTETFTYKVLIAVVVVVVVVV